MSYCVLLKFNESHTGVNIAADILSHFRQWEIEDEIVFVLRDNASNMEVEFCKPQIIAMLGALSPLNHQDGVLLQPAVQQLLATVRSLVGHYHHSNSSFQNFKKIQSQLNLPDHVLMQVLSLDGTTPIIC